MNKKNIINWDFIDSENKYATHGFHTYPAMMTPPVAKTLLKEFGSNKKLVFDPYCGSGTSLVEANIAGINAMGTDLNPLARLIAKAKTKIIKKQTLDLYFKDIYEFLFKYRFGFVKRDSVVIPDFKNIDYWFSKNIKTDLAILKTYIDEIDDEDIKDFFKVAFSQTIRDCSWTRKNEYKLYRMDKEKIRKFKPDVFTVFEGILARNRAGMLDFIEKKTGRSKSLIYDFNTISTPPQEVFNREIDFVMTSPPYGDSKTTVAYGQFSRLANQWFNYENASKIDNVLMGGSINKNISDLCSKSANRVIKKVRDKNEKRAFDVFSFYNDYFYSIKNISGSLKRNAYVCYVVSNRTVCGVSLPTHSITKDFFEENGLTHKSTFERNISNKRLPRFNSPKGITGDTKSLMNKEYIVILKK